MKGNGTTPPHEQFVKLTRRVLEDPKLPKLSINAWRVLVFLMRELARSAGQHNGRLKAPHRQLVGYRVHKNRIASAIAELETAGLISRRSGGMRAPTTFTLKWLPEVRPKTSKSALRSEGRRKKSALRSEGRSASEVRADDQICPHK
jgi:hypothetical protein